MREGPQPQFLFGHAPKLRKAVWFENKEHDDQAADDHQLKVRHDVGGPAKPVHANNLQHHRQQHKEGRARKGAKD